MIIWIKNGRLGGAVGYLIPSVSTGRFSFPFPRTRANIKENVESKPKNQKREETQTDRKILKKRRKKSKKG